MGHNEHTMQIEHQEAAENTCAVAASSAPRMPQASVEFHLQNTSKRGNSGVVRRQSQIADPSTGPSSVEGPGGHCSLKAGETGLGQDTHSSQFEATSPSIPL